MYLAALGDWRKHGSLIHHFKLYTEAFLTPGSVYTQLNHHAGSWVCSRKRWWPKPIGSICDPNLHLQICYLTRGHFVADVVGIIGRLISFWEIVTVIELLQNIPQEIQQIGKNTDDQPSAMVMPLLHLAQRERGFITPNRFWMSVK